MGHSTAAVCELFLLGPSTWGNSGVELAEFELTKWVPKDCTGEYSVGMYHSWLAEINARIGSQLIYGDCTCWVTADEIELVELELTKRMGYPNMNTKEI